MTKDQEIETKTTNLIAPISREYCPNPAKGGIATKIARIQITLIGVRVSMVSGVTAVHDRSNPITDLQRIAASAVMV